jgi:hypothetical protein
MNPRAPAQKKARGIMTRKQQEREPRFCVGPAHEDYLADRNDVRGAPPARPVPGPYSTRTPRLFQSSWSRTRVTILVVAGNGEQRAERRRGERVAEDSSFPMLGAFATTTKPPLGRAIQQDLDARATGRFSKGCWKRAAVWGVGCSQAG